MTHLFIDIETYRCTDPSLLEIVTAGIEAPSNYKSEDAIAAHKAKATEEKIAATVFDGSYGRVICACVAIDNAAPFTCAHPVERDLLADLFGELEHVQWPTYCGHNVTWDLRFLLKRATVHGVRPPAHFVAAARAKPWGKEVIDTIQLWDDQKRISLHALCTVLGVPTPKGDMDGSKVGAAYEAGEMARIAEYCSADVRAVRECYNRMMFA